MSSAIQKAKILLATLAIALVGCEADYGPAGKHLAYGPLDSSAPYGPYTKPHWSHPTYHFPGGGYAGGGPYEQAPSTPQSDPFVITVPDNPRPMPPNFNQVWVDGVPHNVMTVP